MAKVFCSPNDGFCYAADLKRKLTYFRDESHLNALGSMFYGEHLLNLYKNQSNESSPLFRSYPVVREFDE